MTMYMKQNGKFLRAIYIAALLLVGSSMSSFAQPSPINIQMEISFDVNSDKVQTAIATFEMEGKKISNLVNNLKIEGSKVSFSAYFQGADLSFSGGLAGSELAGTVEVIEKGKNIASGNWSLKQGGAEAKIISGAWKGSFKVQPIPAQRADLSFDESVRRPAYIKKHPKVLFDEAHNNVHTASGLYKPFANLIANDGYSVTPNKDKFHADTLRGYDILVIVNAAGPRGQRANPAFTDEECDAVRDWVMSGGSLLFIADHAPMGAAAESLAKRFGVDMSKAYTDDPSSKDKVLGDILFSRENKLLVDSPVTRGRNPDEQISRVITFTGQSLRGGAGSEPLLLLPATAVDTYPQTKQSASAAGRSQGLTIKFGKGRVVVLGEAGMLTAQIDDEGRSFGMNYPNIDNKQLTLNIMHWLSRLLK